MLPRPLPLFACASLLCACFSPDMSNADATGGSGGPAANTSGGIVPADDDGTTVPGNTTQPTADTQTDDATESGTDGDTDGTAGSSSDAADDPTTGSTGLTGNDSPQAPDDSTGGASEASAGGSVGTGATGSVDEDASGCPCRSQPREDGRWWLSVGLFSLVGLARRRRYTPDPPGGSARQSYSKTQTPSPPGPACGQCSSGSASAGTPRC